MSRRSSVFWVVLGLLLIALLGGRALLARRAAASAQAGTTKLVAALELGPADIVTLQTATLTRTLQVSGSLSAVNSAFVKARVAAEVKSVAVREGDSVRAGQVLARLDDTEFDWKVRQAEQQAAAAKAQLDIAQRSLQNNTALMAQGFIAATALQTAVANEAGASATLQAALAGVELARKARADTVVTAPLAGQIAQRLVQPGERVPVDAKLLEIVDLGKLELQASVPPAEAGALRVGALAVLQVDGLAAPVTARVARINPSAQAGSRAVLAYLELPGQPGLRQGLFARGHIELERRETLLLPLSAVRADQAQAYALQVGARQVDRRVLQLGARGQSAGADVVEIIGGLRAGDRVLAGTVGAVRDGTAVRLAADAAAPAPAGASGAR